MYNKQYYTYNEEYNIYKEYNEYIKNTHDVFNIIKNVDFRVNKDKETSQD